MLTLLLVLSLFVSVGVFYQLRLTALTLTGDADCGYTEHTHSEECIQKKLICQLEETAHSHSVENGCFVDEAVLTCDLTEHVHGDDCYLTQIVYDCAEEHEHTEECPSHEERVMICTSHEHTHSTDCYAMSQILTCDLEESAQGHIHTDACYEIAYICGFEADYHHVHTTDCYSDDSADVETAAVWEATVKNAELTGNWAEDLVAVAKTQLGYTESTSNWRADGNHEKKGYTRYGAWYGSPYGDWCAMFVSFCMNYADIPEDVIPYGAGCNSWMRRLENLELINGTQGYVPKAGDIVFLDCDADGASDRVGIVESVDGTGITTIEGDRSNAVAHNRYGVGAPEFMGYCSVGEIYEMAERTEKTAAPMEKDDLLTSDTAQWEEEALQAADDAAAEGELAALNRVARVAAVYSISNVSDFSQYYVGFYGGKVSVSEGYTAQCLYTLPNNQYETAGSEEERIGAAEIVYCFNMDRLYPKNKSDGTSVSDSEGTMWRNLYSKIENADAEDLDAATDNNTLSGELFRKRIMSIALNGYPHNYSNLQGGLSDDIFYAITQYAIWTYTDPNKVASNPASSHFNAEQMDVYNKLISPDYDLPDSVLNRMSNLSIYNYEGLIDKDYYGGSWSDWQKYDGDSVKLQNLLSVGRMDDELLAGLEMQVTKTVAGDGGDLTRDFNFTITLSNKHGNPINGAYTVTSSAIDGVSPPSISDITFVDGIAAVKLRHGQSIAIRDLPSGFHYTVTELEADLYGYTTTMTNGSSSSGVSTDIQVIVTNEKTSDGGGGTSNYEAEIIARKLMDGEAPGDKVFTFILRNGSGKELQRTTNDADGSIRFRLSFSEAGTYTYTMEELNDGQVGVLYDEAKQNVTVVVEAGSEELQKIKAAESFTGGYDFDEKFFQRKYVTDNNGTCYDGYGIDASKFYLSGAYTAMLNPSESDLAAAANNGSSELKENMRKLLYYFGTHSLNQGDKESLVYHCLSGISDAALNEILADSTPPDDYTLVLFMPETSGNEPIIIGFEGGEGTVQVSYNGSASEPPVFNNTSQVYTLPETGGVGNCPFIIGGMLLMAIPIIYFGYGLRRKQERGVR